MPRKRTLRTAASHLCLNAGRYWFRQHVPVKIQPILGQREIYLTLRTGDLRLARKKALSVGLGVAQIFNQARRGDLNKLTPDQIKPYVQFTLARWLSDDEKERAHPSPDTRWTDYRHEIATLKHILGGQFQAGPLRELEGATETALALVALDGDMMDVELPVAGTPEYAIVRREVAKGLLPYFQALQARSEGDQGSETKHIADMQDMYAAPQKAEPVAVQPKQSGPQLSSLVASYLEHSKPTLAPRSLVAYRDALKLFLEIVGDMPAQELGHVHLSTFSESCRRLPAHRSKKAHLREKSIQQLLVIEFPAEERVSEKTASDCLGKVGAFLTWAVNHGHVAQNYADKKGVRVRKSVRESRYDLIPADGLMTLFNSDLYMSEKAGKMPWRFWMPLLGHFTGARAGELAQLRTEDVRQLPSGVWVLDINEDEAKRVKTAASIRIVPLHPFLIDVLKFSKFIERVTASGETRVFYTLKQIRDEPAAALSRWFGDYLKSIGVRKTGKNERKVFHSFRHNFKTACKRSLLPKNLMDDFIGHEAEGMAAHYEHETPPDMLYAEIVLKVDLGVDLGHLAESAYIKGL